MPFVRVTMMPRTEEVKKVISFISNDMGKKIREDINIIILFMNGVSVKVRLLTGIY